MRFLRNRCGPLCTGAGNDGNIACAADLNIGRSHSGHLDAQGQGRRDPAADRDKDLLGLSRWIRRRPDLSPAEQSRAQHAAAAELGSCSHDHQVVEQACCGHTVGTGRNTKDLILHPLLHVAKISAFIFLITFAAACGFSHVRSDELADLFLKHPIFQPFVTALIGLIPNCAASVAIAEMYLRGAISYGSTISGLASGCGMGSLVLFRENKNLRDTLIILGYLLLSSVTAGILIQWLCG